MGDEDNGKDSENKGTEVKKDSDTDKDSVAAESKDDSGIEERIASLEESFHSEVNRLNDAIAAMVANGATIREDDSGTNGVNAQGGDDDANSDTQLEDMDFKV